MDNNTLELTLYRIFLGEDYTIGELHVDDEYFCDTLEDKVRILNDYEDKVYAETAIPYGRYKVILSYSNRFKKELPELLNVEFFNGIRIHSGNHKDDTEGCILVGVCRDIADAYIYNSKNTFNKLYKILKKAIDNEKKEVYITITSDYSRNNNSTDTTDSTTDTTIIQ